MKRFGYALIGAVLTVVLGLLFVGNDITGWVMQAQEKKPVKVTYSAIQGGEYRIDAAHSTIGFAVRHNEVTWISGLFTEFSGNVRYDDKDVTKSSVEFTAKVESINTGVPNRDKHLRTADFFEVEKYPQMTFKSTRVE